MSTARRAILLLALLGTACARRCGGLGGGPPGAQGKPFLGPDGREHTLVRKGAYRAYYDHWGRLEKIEWDSGGYGVPDHIAHYQGGKTARLIEIDEDHDRRIDRWEYYDDAGVLLKAGHDRKGRGAPDTWTFPGANGVPRRVEVDDDGDGKVERAEIFEEGRLASVELDTDRDGHVDRWQRWVKGRLRGEELDTDGDGKPDRRVAYDENGKILGIERLER
jgi:hypothetical protein